MIQHEGCVVRDGLISGDLNFRQGAGILVRTVVRAHPAPT